MNVRRATKRDLDDLTLLIGEGFLHLFMHMTKDLNVVRRFLKKSLIIEHFYVLEVNNRIIGTLAISPRHSRSAKIDSKQLRYLFGMIKGTLISFFLKNELMKPVDAQCFIEYVVIMKEYQGQGYSKVLINEVIKQSQCQQFILDVTSDNEKAYQLYKSLGFKEIKRIKERFSKQAGFEERIYMELLINNNF